MSGEKPSSETRIEHVNERLSAGIETCRSVVANYKSLLSQSAPNSEAENSDISDIPIAERLQGDPARARSRGDAST